ncbi:MAG: hypothetical protein ACLQVD_12925, partial [Capsulimonadaceae bacterium]
LDSIGALTDDHKETLRAMEPKLASIYGAKGSWKDMVHEQMDFPDTLPASIRAHWKGYCEAAKRQYVVADPEEFAMMFIDQNFPDIVEQGGGGEEFRSR